jgi:hypothetical protein
MRNRKQRFLFLFIGFVLAACNLPRETIVFPTATPVAPLPSETSVFTTNLPVVEGPQPTASPQPTATPTFIPPSPLPSATQIPTITLTPTLRPTNTSTPNPRPAVSAAYLSSPPKIDGPWDEWSSTQYPLKYVVWKASDWTGSSDLQASYRVGWDASYLYLAVKVYDDVYAQHETGANLYLGDSLELLLSTNPYGDSAAAGLTAYDYQIGISPGYGDLGDDTEAYLWFPKTKEGTLSSVPIGVEKMDGGYRIEFAVPWSVFGMSPAKGQVYGFAISVSDNDKKDQNVQQTMISSVSTRWLANPASWGLLTLK